MYLELRQFSLPHMASNNAYFAVFSALRPGQVEKLQGGAGCHLEILDGGHWWIRYRKTLMLPTDLRLDI